MIFSSLQTLSSYRDLLWLWTMREIKVRYKQSLLGGAWAILQPLSLTIIFTFVFSYFVGIDTGDVPYPLFAYSALLPWTLFTTAVSFAIPSLVTNLNLVTKVYFPREVLPLAAVGAAIFDFLVALTIFFLLLFIYRTPLSWNIIWLPVIVGVQVVFTLGVVLIGASVNVYYRDVRFVIPLGLQLWMYASPIIYPLELAEKQLGSLFPLYLLNPMAGLIHSYRRVLLHGQSPDTLSFVSAVVVAILTCYVGYRYFKGQDGQFADVI